MTIAVIGATGRAGSRIVDEALRRGHTVTAVARNPESLAAQPRLSLKAADANDAAQLAAAIAGNDAVVSAVPFIDSDPQVLINAVRRSGVKRYLIVGGASSLFVAPGRQLIDEPYFPAAAKPEASKGRDFLTVLRDVDDLDWTYLSPSASFDPGERTGHYRIGADDLLVDASGKSAISMEDYSIAVLDELEHPQHVRQRFTVGN